MAPACLSTTPACLDGESPRGTADALSGSQLQHRLAVPTALPFALRAVLFPAIVVEWLLGWAIAGLE